MSEPDHAAPDLAGLSPEEVERSRSEHGSNRLVEITGRTFWSLYREALGDRTLRILMMAAALVLVVDFFGGGHYADGIAILLAVAVASVVTSVNDWRAQAEFKSLQVEREAFRVRVLRGGEVTQLTAFDVVVGDVVELEAGDKVPADGRLLWGLGLLADESMLTGEPGPVERDATSELRAGTLVVDGRGLLGVTAVGDDTEYGHLRAQLAVEQDQTPLQERLGTLADRIGLVGLGAAVAIFAALLLAALAGGQLGLDLASARVVLSYVAIAVTIVVVAVPEGLPVAVTISLAYSVMEMARDRSLVRRLMACETMGGSDVLCVDKTGTLTLNRMTVERVWHDGADDDAPADAPPWLRGAFAEIAAVNATAHLGHDAAGTTTIGNPTEGALLQLVEAWELRYLELRRDAVVLGARTFTSDRKRMSTVVQRGEGARSLVKGAPEVVLASCTHVLGAGGPRLLDGPLRARIGARLDAWAGEGQRTLALARRDLDPTDGAEEAERALVLVAVVAIGDPVRDEVPEAVRRCRAAGVEVKMITGDSRLTARSIALRVGLLAEGDLVLDGDELRALSDDALDAQLDRIRVVARAVPSDKLRLVERLKRAGRVVSVTGDGTNDGPALRHADVGLSMGLSGTDVAREASDIVILDDDFSSVVRAIRWGRAIFENIRKFLQFQLTVSLVALCTAFVAALTGMGTPLTVVQLLWVNLIMDTLAALALSIGEPADELLEQPPHGRHEPLVTAAMWAHIVALGALMLGVMFVALYTDLLGPRSAASHYTFVFNAFVFLQVGNLLNCRTTRFDRGALSGLAGSRLFLAIFAIIVAAQVVIVQLGGSFFRTMPLSGRQWVISIGLALMMVGAGALLRLVGRALPTDWPDRLVHLGDAVRQRVLARWDRARAWGARPAAESPVALVGASGALAATAGLALRSLGSSWVPIAFALFAAGMTAVAVTLWERRVDRGAAGVREVKLRTALALGLALVLVGYANHLAARHHWRLDLTAARIHTLSPQSRQILEALDQPVRFTAVFRSGRLATEVQDLLAEYQAMGRWVELHQIDPDRNPGEVERLADRIGLTNPSLSSVVVVEVLGRNRVLSIEDLVERQYEYRDGRRLVNRGVAPLFRGEEALSSALVALTNDDAVRVCFALGHGERSPTEFGAEGLALLRDRLRRDGYLVSAFNLVEGARVPSGCGVLVQAGPRHAISGGVRTAIDDYLREGGKWLVTVEPWQTGGLDPLLAEWGLEVRPLYLADPTSAIAGLGATTLVASNYPNHTITAPLAGIPLVFPYATSVRRRDSVRPLEGANLVLTSTSGIGETDRGSRVPKFDKGVDRMGDLAVAAAVDEPARLFLADGRREPARIVAVGDTDFFTNAHLHRLGNADFAMNAIDWLARREALIAVRARPAEDRTLSLSVQGQSALYWMSLGLVPGLVALLGGLVAWRRRR